MLTYRRKDFSRLDAITLGEILSNMCNREFGKSAPVSLQPTLNIGSSDSDCTGMLIPVDDYFREAIVYDCDTGKMAMVDLEEIQNQDANDAGFTGYILEIRDGTLSEWPSKATRLAVLEQCREMAERFAASRFAGGLPIDMDKAREKIQSFLNNTDGERLIVTEAQNFFDQGWLFYYETESFVQTGDDQYAMLGNVPYFVDRYTGRVYLKSFQLDEGQFLHRFLEGREIPLPFPDTSVG
ncbi:MAG: hypothetical protein JNM27_03350 [Leptospirales bacterium]|nr:hypothetical protein [Leptospirales bacterium]